jgi:hypothetical protein
MANSNNTASSTNNTGAAQPTMADLQREATAANAAAAEGSWYTSTPAKVVGGMVVVAAVAVAGYYAYQHFFANAEAPATDLV